MDKWVGRIWQRLLVGKRSSLKSAARYTLYSTLLMTAANIIFYLIILNAFLTEADAFPDELTTPLLLAMGGLLVGTALMSYFISSLLVDRMYNPIRVMIGKIKEMGERHYASRLVIDSDEDELVEYADAFNDMALKINGYIEKQKRFVSDASHELATPITIINGHADMLLRWAQEDPDALASSLSVIKNEALRMNDLVEKLLFLAREDSNRQPYQFQPTDLRRLITDCVEEAQGLFPAYDFTITHADEYTRLCDGNALRRVFRILFDNAVKYSREDKRVEVRSETVGDGLRVRVSDHGIGIPPEHLLRIFDRFYRVDDSRAKQTGGTGLGLAIAKEIVEHHGGTILAENLPDGGTAMVMNLHQTFTNQP